MFLHLKTPSLYICNNVFLVQEDQQPPGVGCSPAHGADQCHEDHHQVNLQDSFSCQGLRLEPLVLYDVFTQLHVFQEDGFFSANLVISVTQSPSRKRELVHFKGHKVAM